MHQTESNGFLSHLTESLVRELATPQSFERGHAYQRRGAVLSLVRRGNILQAEVEGSEYEPYQVQIREEPNGTIAEGCTCPYEFGGICKHSVAVLLALIHTPERVEVRPPLEEALSGLEAAQLRAILVAIATDRPTLADMIERYVQEQRSRLPEPTKEQTTRAKPASTHRLPPLDQAFYRRQTRAILHSLDRMRRSEAYWHTGGIVEEVRRIAEQARPYLEAGDGRSALLLLEAVTEEYMEGWIDLDDSNGELGAFFSDLGELWAEAILTADLTASERKSWAKRFEQWQSEVEDYGIDEGLDVAAEAARQGWNYPPLLRVFEGEITELGAWEDEAPWYADRLAKARLNILERQGRFQEYLHLAEAEGQLDRYVTMLVKLGRVAEAVEYGLSYLETVNDAFALAKALREHNAINEALQVAEQGLKLDGFKTELGRWLRDLASGARQPERGLAAALVVMYESPTLADYRACQNLAGGRWPALREQLLASLRKDTLLFPGEPVAIFLSEGLIDDAIRIADKEEYDWAILEQVADAVIDQRPDWVITRCRKQAETIMDEGRSKYYSNAVDWLKRVKAASIVIGREEEWKAYLADLIIRHRRKHSLIPLLEGLKR